MHTRKVIHQMYWSTVTQIDVSSLVWTVVVPAWLRANHHTIRYITTDNSANLLHHTVTGTALTWQRG